MFNLSVLPFKEEYLLSLLNNNYSMYTIENYRRDLEIFEIFLHCKKINFEQLTKLLINEYKGYLRTGQHLLDIDRLEKAKQNGENNTKSQEIPENSQLERQYKISSYNGSRNGKSKDSGLNSRSINRMLSSVRSFFTFLIDIDQEVPVPPSAIKFIKTEKGEKQVAEFEEIVELIEAPEIYETKRGVRYRNRAMLELLFSTGMRVSELVNLDRENLKITKDGFSIMDSKLYVLGKGKKQRYVYLTHRAIDNLERYLKIRKDEYAALFIPYRGSRKHSEDDYMVRVSTRYVQSIIAKYKKMLGITIPTTPHSLRHGFATYISEQGANPAAIQRLLGHESLQTTTRYVHTSDKVAQKSHKEFHPLQD